MNVQIHQPSSVEYPGFLVVDLPQLGNRPQYNTNRDSRMAEELGVMVACPEVPQLGLHNLLRRRPGIVKAYARCVSKALDSVVAQSGLETPKLVVVGHSLSGIQSIAAGFDERTAAVVSLAPSGKANMSLKAASRRHSEFNVLQRDQKPESQSVAEKMGVEPQVAPADELSRNVRSDQLHGIPVLTRDITLDAVAMLVKARPELPVFVGYPEHDWDVDIAGLRAIRDEQQRTMPGITSNIDYGLWHNSYDNLGPTLPNARLALETVVRRG